MVLYQTTCLINIRPEVQWKTKVSNRKKTIYSTFLGGGDGNKHKPFCIYLHNQHQTHQLVNRYVSFILVYYSANSKYFYLAVQKSSHQKRVTNTSWLLQLPFVTFQIKAVMFLCIWRLINALHYTLGLHPVGACNSVPREQWHGNVRTLSVDSYVYLSVILLSVYTVPFPFYRAIINNYQSHNFLFSDLNK